MGRKQNKAYDEAYSSYMDGLSLEQVAKNLCVTRQCVFVAFKRRGYTLRGVNFQPHQIYNGKKFTLRSTGYYSLTNNDRCLMHRFVWESVNGKIPYGFDIHHIDNNRANNKIENLECLSKSDHTRKYSPHNNQYTKGRVRDTHRTI